MALTDAVTGAAEMSSQAARCERGDDVACRVIAEQEEDAGALFEKLGAANWEEATCALSTAASATAAVGMAALEKMRMSGTWGLTKEQKKRGQAVIDRQDADPLFDNDLLDSYGLPDDLPDDDDDNDDDDWMKKYLSGNGELPP